MGFSRAAQWTQAKIDFKHITISENMALKLNNIHGHISNLQQAYKIAVAQEKREKEYSIK